MLGLIALLFVLLAFKTYAACGSTSCVNPVNFDERTTCVPDDVERYYFSFDLNSRQEVDISVSSQPEYALRIALGKESECSQLTGNWAKWGGWDGTLDAGKWIVMVEPNALVESLSEIESFTLTVDKSETEPEPNIPEEPSTFCGDGNCDSDESCSSCSSDCGACQQETKKSNGESCVSKEDCSSDKCQDGICCDRWAYGCCRKTSDCQDAHMMVCDDFTCKLINGKGCTREEACLSGNCENGVCCSAGKTCCVRLTDCISGQVCDYSKFYCVDEGRSYESDPCPTTFYFKVKEDNSPIENVNVYWNGVNKGTTDSNGAFKLEERCSRGADDRIKAIKDNQILIDMGWMTGPSTTEHTFDIKRSKLDIKEESQIKSVSIDSQKIEESSEKKEELPEEDLPYEVIRMNREVLGESCTTDSDCKSSYCDETLKICCNSGSYFTCCKDDSSCSNGEICHEDTHSCIKKKEKTDLNYINQKIGRRTYSPLTNSKLGLEADFYVKTGYKTSTAVVGEKVISYLVMVNKGSENLFVKGIINELNTNVKNGKLDFSRWEPDEGLTLEKIPLIGWVLVTVPLEINKFLWVAAQEFLVAEDGFILLHPGEGLTLLYEVELMQADVEYPFSAEIFYYSEPAYSPAESWQLDEESGTYSVIEKGLKSKIKSKKFSKNIKTVGKEKWLWDWI